MKNTKPESRKKKIFFIVLSIVAVLIIAGDWALTVMEIGRASCRERV